MILNVFENLYLYLSQKYEDKISNQYFIWVFVLFVVLYFAYAFYCTSIGYNFSGSLSFTWKGVNIGCYR